ncbi:MAG: DUF2971 domain-containing protein [Acetatifactor sp.]|nr:DUF2971 domain-containing protein [Acetatifactor sp.]
MYIEKEWEKRLENISETLEKRELSEVYRRTIQSNIDVLYNSEQLDQDVAVQLIEECEFVLEKAQAANILRWEELEENRILILAYQLYRMDKGAKVLPRYVLQERIAALLSNRMFFFSKFVNMLYFLADLVPDLQDIMSDIYWENDIDLAASCCTILFCREKVICGNYAEAYSVYVDVWKDLLSLGSRFFQEADFVIRHNYVYWLQVMFDNIVTVARMVNRLQAFQTFLDEQLLSEECFLSETEKNYFRMTLRCEICMEQDGEELERRVEEVQKWFHENQATDHPLDTYLYLDFLVRVIRDGSSDKSYLPAALTEYIGSCTAEDDVPDDYLLAAIFRGFSLCGYGKMVNTMKTFKRDMQRRIIFENQYDASKVNIRPLMLWAASDGEEEAVRQMLVLLSRLYNNVFDLEKYIQVKKDCQEDYAYYTTMQTFGYLLLDEPLGKGEKYRLSVMNVDYMNDPNEGRVLQEFLRTHISCDSPLFHSFVGQSDQRARAKADDTLVFLKSFSDKVDRLTMWSEYGDKGNGVCVVMDGATFQNARDKQRLLEVLRVGKSGNERDDYVLYKVIYWDKNQDEFIAKGLDSKILKTKINSIEKTLKQIFAKLERGIFEEWEQQRCMDFLQELFAKIKYLFKFEEYRDENETRVILQRRTVDSFQDIEEAGGEDPLRKKLYIHYPVKSIIKEIILGPKNQQSDEYIPFLVKKMAEINEGSQYSTVVSKSSIDYR